MVAMTPQEVNAFFVGAYPDNDIKPDPPQARTDTHTTAAATGEKEGGTVHADGVSPTSSPRTSRLATAMHKLRSSSVLQVMMIAAVCLCVTLGGWSTHAPTPQPLCMQPELAHLSLCGPRAGTGSGARGQAWVNFPRLEKMQTKTFQQLLDGAAAGPTLVLDIKKAEMATADLATLVRASTLPGKDRIAAKLLDFVADARKTGRGLQKFGAKVGGAVDRIASVNEYALRRIETAAPPPFFLPALWSNRAAEAAAVATVAEKMFTLAMNTSATELRTLVLAAQISLGNLDALEEQLDSLHTVVVLEDPGLDATQPDLLESLWTQLRAKSKRAHAVDRNRELLGELKTYREKARKQVVDALHTLREMDEEMEELRRRVATPDIAEDAIPIGIQMESIKKGIERLDVGRIRAKRRSEEVQRKVLGREYDSE